MHNTKAPKLRILKNVLESSVLRSYYEWHITVRSDIVTLTAGQLSRITQLMDEWSFLWDKRRSLWIAAQDCLDGDQIEEADLDVLLARVERSAVT